MFSVAYAAGPATPTPGFDWTMMLPMLGVFALMYFLMIRPQQQKMKQIKQMQDSLQKGDEVVTTGGIIGRVSKIDENYVALEIAPGVESLVQRHAVQTVLPKGTLKSL